MVNQIVAGVVILSVSMLVEGNMDFEGLLSNQDIFSNALKAWHEYVKKLLSVSTKRNSLNEYNVQRFITEQKMFVLNFQLWQNQGPDESLDDMTSWIYRTTGEISLNAPIYWDKFRTTISWSIILDPRLSINLTFLELNFYSCDSYCFAGNISISIPVSEEYITNETDYNGQIQNQTTTDLLSYCGYQSNFSTYPEKKKLWMNLHYDGRTFFTLHAVFSVLDTGFITSQQPKEINSMIIYSQFLSQFLHLNHLIA